MIGLIPTFFEREKHNERYCRAKGKELGIKFRNCNVSAQPPDRYIEARHKSGHKWMHFHMNWTAVAEWLDKLDTSLLEPENYRCTHCDWYGYKPGKIKLPGITFAVCPKCRGTIKESEVWLSWMDAQRERTRAIAMANGGKILGHDITGG